MVQVTGFTKAERRALRLASDALRCAVAGDRERAFRVVERIGDECGGEGLALAMVGWSDTLIARVPNLTGKPVRLAFMQADSGRVDENADDVPAEVRWSGRLLAARAADDRQTWNALIDALPEDGEQVGHHVGCFLGMVALNIRHYSGGQR